VWISPAGINLIKTFEGLSLVAYKDAVGVWTIGYGHTGTGNVNSGTPDKPVVTPIQPGETITQQDADRFLLGDLSVAETEVNKANDVNLNQNQFDALVSFCYNIGTTAYRDSTLLKYVNEQKYLDAADEFVKWVTDGDGHVIEGLVSRRRAERALFVAPA